VHQHGGKCTYLHWLLYLAVESVGGWWWTQGQLAGLVKQCPMGGRSNGKRRNRARGGEEVINLLVQESDQTTQRIQVCDQLCNGGSPRIPYVRVCACEAG